VTKLVGEEHCRAFHASYGLKTVSMRYFNVVGRGTDRGVRDDLPAFQRGERAAHVIRARRVCSSSTLGTHVSPGAPDPPVARQLLRAPFRRPPQPETPACCGTNRLCAARGLASFAPLGTLR